MRTVFFSYSHEDEPLRDKLEQQLAILKRNGVISTWHDRRLPAGSEFDHGIDENLNKADVVLLLVSPAFLASDYCYDVELKCAMARHAAGEARVIPVILRPCDWHDALFGRLLATPTDGKPVTLWPNTDEAFLTVAKAIKAAVGAMDQADQLGNMNARAVTAEVRPGAAQTGPRSSNLSLAKAFSDRDKDAFKTESFEYMAGYFERSLGELQTRNRGIEGAYRRIDANRFTAIIYREGRSVARCTVFMGEGSFANGIAYSSSETAASNSFNECLTVQADDHSMYLKSMGMAHFGRGQADKLSQEGASELYWGILIEPLQHRS